MRALGFAAALVLTSWAAAGQKTLSPRIVRATILPTGMVMVVREAPVQQGLQKYRLTEIPRAFANTFWFTSSSGIKLGEMTTKLSLDETKETSRAKTIWEYLQANVGGTVTVYIYEITNGEQVKVAITGKLLEIAPNTSVSILQKDGRLRTISYGQIIELQTAGLKDTMEVNRPRANLEISFVADAERDGVIRFVSVEAGAAFRNSYWIDSKGDTVSLLSRVMLISGSLELDEADVKLVVGAPIGFNTALQDHLTGATSLLNVLRNEPGVAAELLDFNADPYATWLAAKSAYEQVNRTPGPGSLGGGGGGNSFAGLRPGSGFVPNGVERLTYDPTANGLMVKSDDMRELERVISQGTVENVFEYGFGRVSIKPGERITRVVDNLTAKAETLHKVIFAQSPTSATNADATGSVVRILKVKNETQSAWPSGALFFSRDNIPLFQGQMPFTSPGKTADIVIGQVEDVQAKVRFFEESRSTEAVDSRSTRITRQMASTATLINNRDEEVEIEVVVVYQGGMVTDAGGAEIIKSGQATLNPPFQAVWRVKIPARSERAVTLKYTGVDVVTR